MRRYVTDTRVAAVREHIPTLRTWRDEKGEARSEQGPKEWHIVTAPPVPQCFVTGKPPPKSLKIGSPAKIVLEIEDDDPAPEVITVVSPAPAPADAGNS